MRRGEIWWAELNPPSGRRPVLLVSRDTAYLKRSLAVVAPVTTRVRNIAAEVPLTAQDGMPQNCVINLDTLVTISKYRLASRLTILTPEKVKEVDAALHFALGLD
jgi:mRNA interferase MazF